jgi:polyisoprenoid-binding protein YceI
MTTTDTTNLPIAAGSYTIDVNHSGVYFQVRHLGISNVRGSFKSFTAALIVGDSLATTSVSATIDMASVDTGQPDRDAHLLGTDFFHADAHPQMTFRSSAVRQVSADEYEMDGELTINGVSKTITFEVEFNGTEVFPADGSTHVGFSATAEARRSDFGIDFNVPLGVGKLAISDKVKIEIDAQFLPA